MGIDFRAQVERVRRDKRLLVGPAVLVVSAGMLAGSISGLVDAAGGSGSELSPEVVAQQIADAQAGLDEASTALDQAHSSLLESTGGPDARRTARDERSVRSVLGALTWPVADSPSAVLSRQQAVDVRYDFLDETSQPLTEFVPAWAARTAASTWSVQSTDLVATSWDEATGQAVWTGTAVLARVSGEDASDTSEQLEVLVVAGTDARGSVTSLEVQLASEQAMSSASGGPSDEETN